MKKLFLTFCILLIATVANAADSKQIGLNVELTPSGTWVNIGGLIDTQNFISLTLLTDLTPNGHTNVEFRAVSRRNSSDTTNFLNIIEPLTDSGVIFATSNLRLSGDTTASYAIKLPFDNAAPYTQIQGKSTTGNTVIGTQLGRVYVSKSKE